MTEVTDETRRAVSLSVNGEQLFTDVDGDETLLQTLRERLDCTSARGTCQIGVCGTCSVLVDGKVVSSCIMLTAQAQGRAVTTSEGLKIDGERLSRVQEAFVQKGAYQCSFCIPAMALSVHAALADQSIDHSVESIREYLAGNLCRCGTYPEVLAAVAALVDPDQTSNEGK